MDTQDKKHLSDDLQEQVEALMLENRQLRDRNENLLTKVGYLENRLGCLAASSTDLTCRLIQSEEERLKISKELLEVKLEVNKMREQYEEEAFELKNTLLIQDGVKTQLGMERQRLCRELESTAARLKVGEKSGQTLTEGYAAMKKNYTALAEAHDRELAQSEELSAELLRLAQAQDDLRKELEEQQQSAKASTKGLHGELDRVRALVSRLSHDRVRPEDLAVLDKDQKSMEKSVLGNQDEMRDMLEKMKNSYEEQQKKLEEKVMSMAKDQQENKRAIHITQQKLSQQSAELIRSQNQVEEVEEANSKLQFHIKHLNEQFRVRLVCYLQDIAEHIDAHVESRAHSEGNMMRTFVDCMLRDVRSSYRVREEQLASAARWYKKRLQRITKTHHALLTAYRVQREQILAKPDCGLNPGPPEANFCPDSTELAGETEKERQHLHQEKTTLEGELQATREQVDVLQIPLQNNSRHELVQLGETYGEPWLDVRKQLKELTDSALESYEKERALLITRATVAEAQVAELQDYVDNHLGRYKQDITHLRRLHGIEEVSPGRSQSAEASLPF